MQELCAALWRQDFKPDGQNTMQTTVLLGLMVCNTVCNVHVRYNFLAMQTHALYFKRRRALVNSRSSHAKKWCCSGPKHSPTLRCCAWTCTPLVASIETLVGQLHSLRSSAAAE